MARTAWSMDGVAPRERFAYWREVTCNAFIPLEPERQTRDTFAGSVAVLRSPRLQVARVASSAHTVRRSRAGIGRRTDGSYFANLILTGQAAVEQFGQATQAAAGDVILVDTDSPFAIRFDQGCDIVCATLPGSLLRSLVTAKACGVVKAQGAGLPVSSYARDLADLPDALDDLDDGAAEQFSALIAHALAPRDTTQHCTFDAILAVIAHDLANPRLSAKHLCTTLGISRSHLFGVLAEAGLALGPYVRGLRLRRSLTDLRRAPADVPIEVVARRWGFRDHAAYTRVFKKAFKRPPGAFRA